MQINKPGQRKVWTQRVSLTLPRNAIIENRLIAKMMGCSLSEVLRKRIEICGPIVAVPEKVTEELVLIRKLLEYLKQTNVLNYQLYHTWCERVDFYSRLIDFDSETTFIHGKKHRSSRKKKEGATSTKNKIVATSKNKEVTPPAREGCGC